MSIGVENYERQCGSGYFDPNDFMSHQFFVNVSLNRAHWYGYVEPYGGYQSFRRNNADSDDLFGGVTGTVGYRFADYVKGELSGEFGNYAVQSASVFEYFLVGGRLI
jgi:hypothetical protein